MNESLFHSIVAHPFFYGMGWALIHFLWQAVLIAFVVAVIFALTRNAAAQIRYLVGCLGIVAMISVPIVTATFITLKFESKNDESILSTVAGDRFDRNFGAAELGAENTDLTGSSFVAASKAPTLSDSVVSLENIASTRSLDGERKRAGLSAAVAERIGQQLHWIVVAWSVGVLLLALRLLLGLIRVGQWRAACQPIQDSRVETMLVQIKQHLQIRFPVQILQTALATAPAAMGWLKPAILIPAELLTGLSNAELESILAHELAHVRRYDYLVNLFQSAIETLLFYHPAVWWLSHRIRIERENCCDDLALSVCNDPAALAKALTRVEELRCQPQLAMAAKGAPLLNRIRRILGVQPTKSNDWWPAGMIALTLLAILIGGMWLSVSANLKASEKTIASVQEAAPKIQDANSNSEDLENKIPLKTIFAENDQIQRVVLAAKTEGRTATDLLRHWKLIPGFNLETSDSITQYETLVSAQKATWIGNAVEAQQVRLNLPEGSNLHAEFYGENVEVSQKEGVATVVITNGRLELIDSGGVIRVWASPDGGAEQLVAECREDDQEYVLSLSTRRIQPDADYPNPPVQCVVNPNTGAPENEEQSPHGAIRYQIKAEVESGEYQFKMSWRYDVKRIVNEAKGNSSSESQTAIDRIPDKSQFIDEMNINGRVVQQPISGEGAKAVLKNEKVDTPHLETTRTKLLKMLENWQLWKFQQVDNELPIVQEHEQPKDNQTKAHGHRIISGSVVDVNGKAIPNAELITVIQNTVWNESLVSTDENGTYGIKVPQTFNEGTKAVTFVYAPGCDIYVFDPEKVLGYQKEVENFVVQLNAETKCRFWIRLPDGSPASQGKAKVVSIGPTSILMKRPTYDSLPIPTRFTDRLSCNIDEKGGVYLTAVPREYMQTIEVQVDGLGDQRFDTRLQANSGDSLCLEGLGTAQFQIDQLSSENLIDAKIEIRFPSINPNSANKKIIAIGRDGIATLEGMVPGNYGILLTQWDDPKGSLPSLPVNMKIESHSTTVVKIVARPSIKVEGVVLTADTRKPVVGTDVSLWMPGNGYVTPDIYSDENGRFSAELPPGKLLVGVALLAPGKAKHIWGHYSYPSRQEFELSPEMTKPLRVEILLPITKNKPDTSNTDDAPENRDADDSLIDWGELAPLTGLRTRLTLKQNPRGQGNDPPNHFRQGRPILFDFEVKNFGDKPTTVDRNQFRPLKLLYAVGAKGGHAPIRWPSETKEPEGPYVADEVVLQPGESLMLWEDLDVSPMFELKPGHYEFRARGGPWALHEFLKPSNEQQLLVTLPKRQLTYVASVLKSKLPDELSVGNASEWEIGSTVVIYLKSERNQQKTQQLRIWISESAPSENVFPDASEQAVLGKTEFGYLVIDSSMDTGKYWPNYRTVIREAVEEVFEQGELELRMPLSHELRLLANALNSSTADRMAVRYTLHDSTYGQAIIIRDFSSDNPDEIVAKLILSGPPFLKLDSKGELIGKCEHGEIYVVFSEMGKDRWPDYRKNIVEAAKRVFNFEEPVDSNENRR